MSRQNGELKKFFADKGYGFIKTSEKDIFFHVSDLQNLDADTLELGMILSYEKSQDDRSGKVKAIKVQAQ